MGIHLNMVANNFLPRFMLDRHTSVPWRGCYMGDTEAVHVHFSSSLRDAVDWAIRSGCQLSDPLKSTIDPIDS